MMNSSTLYRFPRLWFGQTHL